MKYSNLILFTSLAGFCVLIANPSYGNAQPLTNDDSLPVPSSGFPLQQGSRGNEVVQLQNALYNSGNMAAQEALERTSRKNGYWDGIFGPGTEEALLAVTGKTAIAYDEFVTLLS